MATAFTEPGPTWGGCRDFDIIKTGLTETRNMGTTE